MESQCVQTSTWLLDEWSSKDKEDNHVTIEVLTNGGSKKASPKKRKMKWKWSDSMQGVFRVTNVLSRVLILLLVLYFFICALGLLEDAFKLLGGRAAGETFRNSDLLSNPLSGLMIGILVTVLVQSSSTASSIIVAMVASQVIPLDNAIPIIMGTNVGTSVTSTIVSLAQAKERSEFRRAFAGATVHDMFNWSAVFFLLPLEVASKFLYRLSKAIVDSMNLKSDNYQMEMLTTLTRPLTDLIVQINRGVITDIAMAPNVTRDSSVMRRWCHVVMTSEAVKVMKYNKVEFDCGQVSRDSQFYHSCTDKSSSSQTSMEFYVGWNETKMVNKTLFRTRCNSLFAQTDMTDTAAGAILLVLSIVIILSSLLGVVKILNSLLKGPVARLIHKTVNADFPGRLGFLTGYVAILVGCGLTIVIQSSSVFTSTLTPLVGVGIVSVERMYPMTLGSNIGTTVTGILAAMSTKGNQLAEAMQIAMCHLFFNVTAMLIFYPVPLMRFPVSMAKTLGRITSKHRWFAGFYLIVMFIVMPAFIFGLSVAGMLYLALFGGPLLLFFLVVIFINILQVKRPNWLPKFLRDWNFLPIICHSWKPVDNLLGCLCLQQLCYVEVVEDDDDGERKKDGIDEEGDGNVKTPVKTVSGGEDLQNIEMEVVNA